MEKIYDKKTIKAYITASEYSDVLDSLDIDFYLIKLKLPTLKMGFAP